MARKLYYFDTKGFGESIRYLLHYGGLEFEDIRFAYGGDEWPKQKEILAPPFGKMPLYKEGDRTLHQSMVIARYIGKQLNLAPTDPWEEANAEVVLHTMNDFFTYHMRSFFLEQDSEKKAAIRKEIIEEHIPYYFERFNKILQNNKGHFANKLSWIDIVFVACTEFPGDFLEVKIQDNYKYVAELMNEVFNLKGIKEYIAKRDKK